jgi:hypothetical protein
VAVSRGTSRRSAPRAIAIAIAIETVFLIDPRSAEGFLIDPEALRATAVPVETHAAGATPPPAGLRACGGATPPLAPASRLRLPPAPASRLRPASRPGLALAPLRPGGHIPVFAFWPEEPPRTRAFPTANRIYPRIWAKQATKISSSWAALAMITEQKPVIGCGVSTIMKGSRESVAGRASGLPAPVSVRRGKPKDRRRPRLPADGSGNQCLRRASFSGSIVHSVPFRGSRPRGIAAPGGVGEPLQRGPVGMSGPRRNCVAGLRVRAGCTWPRASPRQRKRTSGAHSPAAVHRPACGGTGLAVRCRKPPLTLAVTGSFDLPRRRARDSH